MHRVHKLHVTGRGYLQGCRLHTKNCFLHVRSGFAGDDVSGICFPCDRRNESAAGPFCLFVDAASPCAGNVWQARGYYHAMSGSRREIRGRRYQTQSFLVGDFFGNSIFGKADERCSLGETDGEKAAQADGKHKAAVRKSSLQGLREACTHEFFGKNEIFCLPYDAKIFVPTESFRL